MRKRIPLIGICMLFGCVLVTTPALAVPIIFTDRSAFNAAVGSTTLLTFDTLPPVTVIPLGGESVTFDGLLEFRSDSLLGYDSMPGTFCFCNPTFNAGAVTLNPVLAFGLDITPLVPNANVVLGDRFLTLTAPQFFGVLYSEPTTFTLSNALTPIVGAGLQWSTFTVDNVAIKAVPEPSSMLFLGLGLLGLYRGRKALARSSNR